MKPLIEANQSVLTQLKDLVLLCDDLVYNGTIPNTKSSIGKHVRHILDHFRAAKFGLSGRVIDYNIRSRNSLEETDREAAIEQIDRLSNWFLETEFNNQTVDVISEIQIFQTCSRTFCSTTEREFLYLINHSIHHMAYAALLGKLQGLTIPHHIGLAPSTATYERNIEGKKHEAFAQ